MNPFESANPIWCRSLSYCALLVCSFSRTPPKTRLHAVVYTTRYPHHTVMWFNSARNRWQEDGRTKKSSVKEPTDRVRCPHRVIFFFFFFKRKKKVRKMCEGPLTRLNQYVVSPLLLLLLCNKRRLVKVKEFNDHDDDDDPQGRSNK